jgi:hypothetical protein
MLATFGLERIESGLNQDTVTATDVAEFLEQAQPDEVGTLAREGMPEALECLHRRRSEGNEIPWRKGSAFDRRADAHFGVVLDEPGLPTRINRHARANPQFQPPRHANRV